VIWVIYEKQIVATTGTTRKEPDEEKFKITKGIITIVGWFWPRGTKGYAHLIVEHFGRQIWPSEGDQTLKGNGEYQAFPEWYVIKGTPIELTLKAWNGGSFNHTATLRFNLLPFKVAFAQQDLLKEMRSYNELVRQLWLRPRTKRKVVN